jgi:hypothetical protein
VLAVCFNRLSGCGWHRFHILFGMPIAMCAYGTMPDARFQFRRKGTLTKTEDSNRQWKGSLIIINRQLRGELRW